MPRLAAILILTLFYSGLGAQSLDSLLTSTLDSAQSKVNVNRLDSVGLEKRQKLDSVQSAAATSFNSLKESYDSVSSVADKSINKYQHAIDSLNNLKLPTDKITSKLDSVLNWKNSKLGAIKGKADGLRSKTIEKINTLELPPELQGPAKELTSSIQKLDVSLPKAQLPDLSVKNSLSGPGIGNPLSGKLDGKSVPGLPAANAGLPQVGDLGDKVKQQVPGLENLGEAGEKVQEVSKMVPKSIDDVPQALEQQVTKIDQVNALSGEMGKVDQLKSTMMPGQDQEAIKQQMLQQAKEVAIDHFAGKEQQLQEAMEKIAKYKQKYSSVQSLADLPKRKPNEMHGKPLIERLVPGVYFQVFKRDGWMVDFNGYVGYRLSGRFTTGMGWNQRVAYQTKTHSFTSDNRVFGPRMYVEFKAFKGFSPRIEAEWMNTRIPPTFSSVPNDPTHREWVFTTMVGLKKEYKFIKNVKGTFLILYNMYDPHHHSPYPDRVNTRFGFEFPLKKKVKTKKTE